jgi:hypothetical protein
MALRPRLSTGLPFSVVLSAACASNTIIDHSADSLEKRAADPQHA